MPTKSNFRYQITILMNKLKKYEGKIMQNMQEEHCQLLPQIK